MLDLAEQIVEGARGRATDSLYTDTLLKSLITRTYNATGYEAEELEYFLSALDGCDLFIDLGANSGRYTYSAAQRLHGAAIVSIEANAYLIPLLESLTEILARECPDNSYRVVNAAILDKPGTVEFFVAASPTVGSVFSNTEGRSVRVEATTLDAFYQPAHKTLLKIDVEGAEYRVLQSALRFVDSRNCEFFLELHGWGDETVHKYPVHVLLFMAARGYAVRQVGRHHFFKRASALKVWASCLAAFPYLFGKYLLYRYARKLTPSLKRLRAFAHS